MKMVYKTRWEFIEPFVFGKKVLDVGPAELIGTIHRHKEQESIHKRIATVSQKVIGLEKNKEQVQALQRLGYHIIEGDAEEFRLNELFDVIVAGELIEHLSNPGAFLECARRHLEPDGILVLTTPNRFSASVFLSALLHNNIPSYNKPIAKHVAYYDENCFQDLLRRHGYGRFTIAYYEWIGIPNPNLKIKFLNTILRCLHPQFSAGLMIAAHMEERVTL